MTLARGLTVMVALALMAEMALAQLVPWHSPFPRPRPTVGAGVPAAVPPVTPATEGAVAAALEAPQQLAGVGVTVSPRPRPRPPAAAARFAARGVRAPDPVRTAARPTGGGLCGVAAIEGRTMNRIPGRLQGCGVEEPVSITAVHGIALSQASTVDCETARAVASFVGDVMVPTIGGRGGGLERVTIAAHYSCRTRNNRPGAPISEHGRGRAIDIAGYRLRDGTTVTVLQDWDRRPHRNDLREMYERACGIFTTTLGPNSDRYHQDHFHFDRARHRNGGTYCR